MNLLFKIAKRSGIMIVEGLGSVTFVNGILRVETLMVKSDGTVTQSGSIEIPGNMTGEVINGLVRATQGIQDKLSENDDTQIKIEEDSSKEPKTKSKKKKK